MQRDIRWGPRVYGLGFVSGFGQGLGSDVRFGIQGLKGIAYSSCTANKKLLTACQP